MTHKTAQKLDPREQHYWIESPRPGMQLFLRYLPPLARQTGRVRPILYIHGATFPSALSIAYRFGGYSWRDALCEAGFDVWGFDFHGYGIFGPISRDERTAGSKSTALPRSRGKRATRGGRPLHSPLPWSIQSIDNGVQCQRAFFVGALPDNGGPNDVIWRNRSPSAAQIRKAADSSSVAHRYG